MKNLKVALAAACAVVVGWAFTASADIPASAYVQTGLVAQWDGIENVGAGQPHDGTASTWTDLKGGRTVNRVNSGAGGSWGENCFIEAKSAGSAFWVEDVGLKSLIAGGELSVDIFCEHSNSATTYEDWLGFGNSSSARWLKLDIRPADSSAPLFQGLQYRTTSWNANAKVPVNTTVAWDKPQYGAVVCTTNGTKKTSTLYGNDATQIHSVNYGTSTPSDGVFTFGGFGKNASLRNAKIYGVRIYDRALTADEMSWNGLIDSCRFSANPSLYRLTGVGKGVECAVVVEIGSGNGAFAVNDEDAGTRYEEWFAVKTERTFAICAKPDAGWRFVRWEGDVGGFTSAEKGSPTVTVTTDKALALRAVFHFDLPASAYVQDGLAAHWDAIENAGAGQHDAAATTWVDLSGNGHDAAMPASGAVIEDTFVKFTNVRAEASGCDFANHTTPLTLDGSCRVLATTSKDSMGFMNVQNRAVLNVDVRSAANPPTEGCYNFGTPSSSSFGSHKMHYFWARNESYKTHINVRRAIAAVFAVTSSLKAYPKDSPVPLYDDGEQQLSYQSDGWASSTTAKPTGLVYIGATTTTFEINGARIYDRELTADEIKRNALVDKVRFDGADPSELDWPTGFRFNDEKARIETLLDLSGAEGATVSFDNETFETSTNGWFALGTSVTVYAKPVAGQSIAAWTGLPDGAQVSDDKTTATFALTGPMSVSAVSHAPMTLRWRGGASELASDVANWAKDDGSAAALPPQGGDAVHFDADSPSMTWDLDGVTLASWTQDEDFTGTNTFLTGPVHEGVDSPTHGVLSADGKRRELIVTGDITLNGGRWHQANTPSLAKTHPGWTTGEGVYRLIARAGGNFTVGAKAVVEANLSGFRKEQGPGKTGSRGATHGGSDNGYYAGNSASPETNHYGSVRHPVTQGSGAVYSVGGGALELSADGAFALDGALEADGGSYLYYTGSGGSVFVTAATLTGTGHVYACGYCTTASAGAGGRLAFVQTGAGATFDGFTGTLRCYGNSGHSNPGTIYWETPADKEKGGVLEIRGRNSLSVDNRGYYTMLVNTGEDFTFDTLVLTNKVKFAIGPGVTLKANRIVSNTTNNRLVLLGGKLVVPDGYALTNVILRNDYYPSAVGTPAGATGTNLLAKGATFTIDRRIDFDGTFRMLSGAKVNHTAAASSDADLFRADFTAREFVLDSGATVDLTALGYPAASGPGKPTDDTKTSRGGSHGGLAHDVGSIQVYGSITRPVTLGSGGLNGIGGGATHIVVSGRSVIDGTIAASGQANKYSGAGGSVWLETGTLEGASTGVISANGGKGSDGYEFYAGAGGRVAVTLTEPGADFSQYQGAIRAKGAVANVTDNKVKTYYAAGNGTVYLRKGGETETEGTLIVDGDATCVNDDNFTDITMDVTENTVGHVVITNGGNLRVRKGARLDVRRSFANNSIHQGDRVNGEAGDDALAAGAVAFVDRTVEATVTGTNAFMRLLADEPGKTIRFGAAGDSLAKIDPLGSFDVAGTAETLVFLRGLMDGTPWLLELRGKANLAYADVKDSDATPGDKVAVDDTNVNSGNNQNWGFIAITPGETITWNGSKGTSFATADNWDRGRPPVDTDVIVIPADAAEMPVLMDVFAANRLTVAAGATLGLNGFSLTVTNGLDCAGTLVCSGAETLTLAGDVTIKHFTAADSTVVLAGWANRTVDFAGQTLRNLEIAGTAGQTTFADGFAADFITCLRTDAASTLVFAADQTVTVGQIKLKGALTDMLPGMTLASSEPGTRWKLNVTGKADVTGVIVTDSDASAGKRVAAFNPSEDGLNNVNWLFGVTQSTWQGPAAGGNWSDAANWADGKIPDKDTRVVFDADATVTIDTPDAVAMQLEVDGATLTVKGTETLTVTTLLEILAGGTLTQNTAGNSIHVEGSAYVRAGGAWTHASNGASDQGFGINATVDGDFTIDSGGKVDAYKKGFNAYKGWATQQQASHGARFNSTSKPCYGSMFRPTDIGSGGGWDGGHAGGRVYLTVKGTLTANGEIDASSMIEAWYPGSGGSVLLTCGRLAGSGLIRAQGGSRSNADSSAGCGGRVALYLTDATDLSDFGGTIQAYGGVNDHTAGSLPIASCGTVYLQTKGVEDGCGVVRVNNGGGITSSGGVDLPVTNRCDDLVKCYKNVTFDVAEGGTLFVTGDVTVKELELGTKSRVNLNGHTLTIRSHAHKKGKGWPSNWNAKTSPLVEPGADADGNPGKIVWMPRGLMIMVK